MAKKLKYDGQDIVATYAEKDSKGGLLTNKVTTDTEQYIYGDKSFGGYVGLTGQYSGVLTFEKLGDIQFDVPTTSSEPLAEIFCDGANLQVLFSNMSNRLMEYNTNTPYLFGNKFCGYLNSASTASTKFYVRFQAISPYTKTTLSTMSDICTMLSNAGHTSQAKALPVTGKISTQNATSMYTSGGKIYIAGMPQSISSTSTYSETWFTISTLGGFSVNKVN